MTLRSIPDTIASLRGILRRLDQSADVPRDSLAFAQLKRIILKRIAALEIEDRRRELDNVRYKLAG
jgi:hypothetical protein